MGPVVMLVILIVLLVLIATSCIKIVPQAHAYVIERLGAYSGTWNVGLHFKIPFIERVARRVNLKE
ncbi:MAG: peptidase, partial [Lachnospiraceae bacterium]|nr:peptidase [Lachnospiraceae bacterium]